jgi:hypothetical protein
MLERGASVYGGCRLRPIEPFYIRAKIRTRSKEYILLACCLMLLGLLHAGTGSPARKGTQYHYIDCCISVWFQVRVA